MSSSVKFRKDYLEIRYPERGRKPVKTTKPGFVSIKFGNKIPREGTETGLVSINNNFIFVFGNKIPREGTETIYEPIKKFKPKPIWK